MHLKLNETLMLAFNITTALRRQQKNVVRSVNIFTYVKLQSRA